MAKRLREALKIIRRTIFHPQWHAFRRKNEDMRHILSSLEGTILDVGCADSWVRRQLPENASYISVDLPKTSTDLYHTVPMVFANAQTLPIKDSSCDCVLLLDVLEHLPEPMSAIREIERILKPGGKAVLQIPFLYPTHDAPYDFTRWTQYGLEHIFQSAKLRLSSLEAIGSPAETAGLLANIALAYSVLRWIERRNPLAVAVLLLPLIVPAINLLTWVMSKFSSDTDLMPFRYRLVLEKPR